MNKLKSFYLHIRFLPIYLKTKYLVKIKKIPKVIDTQGTIQYIIKNKYSFSRYGDGELRQIAELGDTDYFQGEDKALIERLKEILVTKEERFMVGIPDVFKSLSQYVNTSQLHWKGHFYSHLGNWIKHLNSQKQYYDSLSTRFYMGRKDKSKTIGIINLWKQVWDNRDIVIVEGKLSRLGFGNDLFKNSKSVKRILCPAENAFDFYDGILKAVVKVSKDKLIIIALGPTATVLAYDLSKAGFQALDLGHIDIEYEWYRMGASKKVAINNKYVNEIGSRIHSEIQDENYSSSIIEILE